MKQVMVKAWEIAKKGQKKFGGKVKEYFAIALKMAWALVKKQVKRFVTSLDFGRNYWIAEITGTHPQYKLNREFLTENYIEDGERVYKLKDGLYHGKFTGRAHYFVVKNGEAYQVEYEEAYAMAVAME